MNKFIVNVECAIEYKGKFLLIKRPERKHAGGLLSFPGGKFEITDGSNVADALKNTIRREIKEEVGLNIKDHLNYVTSSYFKDSITSVPVVDVVFYCKLIKTSPKIVLLPEEVPEYYWLSYEDIILKDNCPEWLHRYLNIITLIMD